MPYSAKKAKRKARVAALAFKALAKRVPKRIPMIQPDRMAIKLRYSTTGTLNTTVSGHAVHVFRANSVYDPDNTGAGNQPRGFDEWMNLYDHFTVIASKVRAKVYNNNSTGSPAIAYLCATDDNTAHTGLSDALEEKRLKSKPLGYTGASNAVVSLNSAINPNRFLSIKDPMDDSRVQGDSSSDVSEGVFWQLGVGTLDGSVQTNQPHFQIQIDYTVIFHEPKQPIQS